MDQIIYATDCTEHTVLSLRYALVFAQRMNAVMNLVHVYNLPPIDHTIFRSHTQLRQHTQPEQLEQLKAYFSNHASSESVPQKTVFHVEENNLISASIVAIATQTNADLVIVGRKDRKSDRGLLVGNIANALMQKLSCPLLVIPNNQKTKEIDTIVYASDFEADDIIALSKLNLLASRFDAVIHLVHIPVRNEYSSTEQMEWFKELVLQRLGQNKIEFHLLLAQDITKGLQMFIEESGADLLCMLERDEKSYFSKLIGGDTVKRMKSLCEIPLLIYNRKSIA